MAGLHLYTRIRLLAGAWGDGATCHLTRWIFIRALGVIYFIAFVSLGVQILGLSGSNGIQPVVDYLEFVQKQIGADGYWRVPTLAWLNSSDEFLQGSCVAGAVVSLLVIFRVLPGPLLLVLWVMYLSLCSICRPFLNFQWDILLLETGFLAIFFAPWRLRPRLADERAPSVAVLWLLRFLLFKLMFLSGVVKLLSQDKVWWDLTALNYHYETQPLATWTAWYVHQLPQWFGRLSVGVMFFVELVVPFLFFMPRLLRIFASLATIFLMFAIMATGNYTFFNWLAIALCLLLLDDAFLRRFVPRRLIERVDSCAPRRSRSTYHKIAVGLFASAVAMFSTAEMIDTIWKDNTATKVLGRVRHYTRSFRTINTYGLFRVMTKSRPEIIVEGSDDKRTWLAYEFKWKPGDLSGRPKFVAPHQPRLDWQMWFAALRERRPPAWFYKFMISLLEGSPEVLGLLEHNPFPDTPPRFIRARVYDYHFTSWAERQKTGDWWRRDRERNYPGPRTLPRGAKR